MRKLKFLLPIVSALIGTAVWAETKTLTADDFDISTMTTGWNGYARKNLSISDTPLKLTTAMSGDSPVTTEFEKGFGTHANSDYTIQLDGNGVSFSVTVGRDFGSCDSWDGGENGRKLKFQIFDENGTVLAESSEMTRYTPAQNLSVDDLSGKRSIRLHVDPVDGDSWDWADWVNPTLVIGLVAAGDVSVNGNEVADYSSGMYASIGKADVTKGVLKLAAGAVFTDVVTVGANGLIAVDLKSAVTTATPVGTTIDLFSAPSLNFAEGDSAATAVVLVGPTCDYTIGTRSGSGVTTVFATIGDVSRAATLRKVCVWTGASTKWNDEGGNWTSLPTKGSPDIGVFCQDATLDYNADSGDWIVYYDEAILRGAAVTWNRTNNKPVLPMRHVGGKGTLTLKNVTVRAADNSSLTFDPTVLLVAQGADTVLSANDSVSYDGGVRIDGIVTIDYPVEVPVEKGDAYDTGIKVSGDGNMATLQVTANGCENVHWTGKVTPLGTLLLTAKALIGDTVYWTGEVSSNWWEDGNWDQGMVPRAYQNVVFEHSGTVYLNGSVTMANLVITNGAVVRFQTSDVWGIHPSLAVSGASGDGIAELAHSGFKSSRTDGQPAVVSLREIRAIPYGNDCWFGDGPEVRVESTVTGTSYLRIYGTINFVGEVRLTSKIEIASGSSIARFVATTGDIEFADSNGQRIDEVLAEGGVITWSLWSQHAKKITLAGGGVKVASDTEAELGATEAGGTVQFEAASLETVPTWPTGVKFAEDVDLSTIDVAVSAGEDRKFYAITKTETGYVLTDKSVGDGFVWVGLGSDVKWDTPANWLSNKVPAATDSVVFTKSTTVEIPGSGEPSVDTITINAGCTLTFIKDNRTLRVKKVTGEGDLVLSNARLRANVDDWATCEISTGSLKVTGTGGGLDATDTRYISVSSPIIGDGELNVLGRVYFTGDNRGFVGSVRLEGGGSDGVAMRRFASVDSFFPKGTKVYSRGRIVLEFATGTATLTSVDFGESWGAGLYLPKGAEVTLQVADGQIRDTWYGRGYKVMSLPEGWTPGWSFDGLTDGCAGLTVEKVGTGTFVYGMSKAHALKVSAGTVLATGENEGNDTSAATVMVAADAELGAAPAQEMGDGGSHAGGMEVTLLQTVAFEKEAKLLVKVYESESDVVASQLIVPAMSIDGLVVVADRMDLDRALMYRVLSAQTLTGSATCDIADEDAKSSWRAKVRDNAVILKWGKDSPGLMIVVR